jgi:hypothetical protein
LTKDELRRQVAYRLRMRLHIAESCRNAERLPPLLERLLLETRVGELAARFHSSADLSERDLEFAWLAVVNELFAKLMVSGHEVQMQRVEAPVSARKDTRWRLRRPSPQHSEVIAEERMVVSRVGNPTLENLYTTKSLWHRSRFAGLGAVGSTDDRRSCRPIRAAVGIDR